MFVRVCDRTRVPKETFMADGQAPDTPQRAFNLDEALDRVEGDRELLLELVDIFREDLPRAVQEIEEAVAEGDARRLNRGAHTLRGSLTSFAAASASAITLRLESAGRDGILSQAAADLAELRQALSALEAELVQLKAQS
ncbi:MAG: Hpt domain-containing protein [Vicinamibacterales bacterium]